MVLVCVGGRGGGGVTPLHSSNTHNSDSGGQSSIQRHNCHKQLAPDFAHSKREIRNPRDSPLISVVCACIAHRSTEDWAPFVPGRPL